MTILVRPLGYTGKIQQLVWQGSPAIVTAYAWGGGGGGGGPDSNPGGEGSGGGFAQGTFTIVDGDILQVAVGGSGKTGAGGNSAGGGYGGYSYIGGPNYYGGNGGSSGPIGRSGAGGGGGGATVILLNGTPIVIAGGGAGGGGGGNVGDARGQSAPGESGSVGTTFGTDGDNKNGDGGGGGGGGGGQFGGRGGGLRSGDQGGLAGFYGTGLGEVTENSDVQQPANKNSYYVGTPGVGGVPGSSGNAGYASLEFNIPGVYVKDEEQFKGAKSLSVKQNDVWNTVRSIWVKEDGVWKSVNGSIIPILTNINGNFGGPGRICMSVIDECSVSSSTITSNWNTFLNLQSGLLYLLQPGGPSQGNLKVPSNFNTSGQGIGPIEVARDNGNSNDASDWFSIANLSSALPGTTVELSIDTSGSMNRSTVSASYDYFIAQCSAAGINVVYRNMPGENWVAPFL